MKRIYTVWLIILILQLCLSAQWVQKPIETTNTLLDIQFLNNSVGYISDDGGKIYKTTDGGDEWIEQTTESTDFLNSISFINEYSGWAMAQDDGKIYKTTNGGNSWDVIHFGIAENLRDIQFIDNQLGYAVGYYGNIYKSIDGGSTWNKQNSNTTAHLWSIHFISSENGFVAGNGVILKTTNGGSNWEISYQTSSAKKIEAFKSIHFPDNNNGWAVGEDWENGDGAIFHTSNGGVSWEKQNSGVTGFRLQSVMFNDELNGWASGGYGTILSTKDGGETWLNKETGTDNFIRDVFVIDESNVWAVGIFGLILNSSDESIRNFSVLKFDGQAVNDRAGSSVSAGDLNGDGYDDIIIGARNWTSTGRAYIYMGGQNMDSYIELILNGQGDFNYFGESVSTAGDVNGDGYDDVLVGAYGNDGSGRDAGRAYLYYGGANMNNSSDLQFSVSISYSGVGKSVSNAGDLNGDGYDDIIIGAWTTPTPNVATGRAYIYFGGPNMNNTIDVQLNGESSYNYFGESVSSAGDVNGDGYDDVIVGAFGNENGGSYAGRAYIYFGGQNMDNQPDIILTGESGNYFGNSVSEAGDVNGDGYGDVIVGSTSDNNGPLNLGRAHIYFGGTNMNNDADIVLTGEEEGAQFGYSVSSAGDLNNDGYDDVVVGAKDNSQNGIRTGKVYVYFGGPNMDLIEDYVMYGEKVGDEFGTSVTSAGDVNGDGYPEIIVGAPFNDIGGDAAGRSYLYFTHQPPTKPIITIQPQNKTVDEGQMAIFTVQASCDDPIGYQWWKSPFISEEESKIVGAITNQLLVYNTTIEDHNNTKYVCEVYNTLDRDNLWVNSTEAILTVNEAPANAPIITKQPANVVISQGDTAIFIVEAECDDPIGYQWWKVPFVSVEESKIVNVPGKIEGANSNALIIYDVTVGIDDATNYACEVFNSTDHQNYWINTDEISLTIKSLELLAPTGNDEFISNSNSQITWDSHNIDNIRLDFSSDGINWESIINGISTSNSSFDWIIPELTSSNCFIKITDLSDTSIYSINDTSFSIKNDQIIFARIDSDTIWNDIDFDGVELREVNGINSEVNFGNIESYVWTVQDDTVGYGVSPTIELATGTNELVLTVITDLQRMAMDTLLISVYSSKLTTNGAIYSSVSQLSKDEFFISSTDDRIYKFDSTGVPIWDIITGGSIQSTICISNEENIYVGSEDTRLYVFNNTGTPKWDKAMGGIVVSSPSVGPDNNIYLGITTGRLMALEENGTILWSTQVGGAIVSSASISNDNRIYFGSCDKKVYCLNSDGSIAATYETQDSIFSSPAIALDGSIYIGANDGYLYKFDRNLNLKWKYYTLGKVKSSPVIDNNGNVYVGSGSGYLYAFSDSKELLWKYNADSPINGNPSIGPDGTIYVGTDDGRLLALTPQGNLRWWIQFTSPIIAAPLVTDQSLVFISGMDGIVYIMRDPIIYSGSYEITASNQWATFKGNNQRTGFVWDGVTEIEVEKTDIPNLFELAQNYPNPFNPSTLIKFGLPKESHVTLIVYNSLGQEISRLVNHQLKAGYHEVEFNNENYSSGIYFYRLQAGDSVETKKMILLK